MIEIYYSLGLISAAAIFQIIVKFTLNRREKATLLQLEQQQRRMSASSSSLTEMDVASAEALEGDEPAVFFQLLSQTGSEMLMSSRSIETIVRERMDSDEAETVPILATSHTDGSDETPEVGLQQH